jgi:hypothetical protein
MLQFLMPDRDNMGITNSSSGGARRASLELSQPHATKHSTPSNSYTPPVLHISLACSDGILINLRTVGSKTSAEVREHTCGPGTSQVPSMSTFGYHNTAASKEPSFGTAHKEMAAPQSSSQQKAGSGYSYNSVIKAPPQASAWLLAMHGPYGFRGPDTSLIFVLSAAMCVQISSAATGTSTTHGSHKGGCRYTRGGEHMAANHPFLGITAIWAVLRENRSSGEPCTAAM